MNRRRRDRPAVLVLVGAITLISIVALAAATLAFPIEPAIAFPGIEDPELANLAGVAFWTTIALLGSLQAISLRGHGVLTFHMPFILAAVALGGPVAGGWVALLGTFERREFRGIAWYGLVYNHVVLSFAAVVGGVVMLGARQLLERLGADPQLTFVLALAAATVVFAAISTGLVVAAVTLRDELELSEAVEIQVRSYRDTAAAEAIMGWLLAWVYVTIAPWAPVVVFIALLTIWRKTRAADDADWDAQTGVASRARTLRKLEAARRTVLDGGGAIGVLYIDMDGLKRLNDEHGHAFGDLMIEAVGERLSATLRIVDLPGRLGGDEFIVILRDVADPDTLHDIAWRIHRVLVAPIASMPWYEPGASIGALFVDRLFAGNEAAILIATADRAMYVAKNRKLGVHLATPDDLAGAIDQRQLSDRQRRDAAGDGPGRTRAAFQGAF